MTCPTCHQDSPAGARFCINCGARLAQACRTCGAARIGTAKFCGECGTPFADGDAPVASPVATPSPADAPVAERRLVSIMFADLVGFTPFAEERDAEEVREMLTRYFDLATDVIRRYGGTVEKFIGDAVMALWGAPVAQEDDAERAVRAALELVDVVRRLGPGIQARIGVLTGEAAVTIGATNQGMVAGDIVNVAARLQSVAEPGTVLVGEATMRSASAAISFEPIGERALKGKSSPVPAWLAVRVVAERGGRGRADMLEAPFVGREDELHLLKELLHATGREGRARLVSVMGPAGIGKSRLTWEFLKYVDGVTEEVWWHSGRSPAYGEGIAFWALGEMIRGRAGLTADDDESTTRERVAATVREHVPDEDERRWIEPALLALLGIGAEGQASEHLFAAWRTFFERMAETGTVAIVFEDLQWADPGTVDFIEHMLDWTRTSPIMIVTLARPELLERRPDWGAGKRSFTSLYLEPLTEAEMRELLAGLVPGLPRKAVDGIVARADGIPLYAVETVRTLIAQGRIGLEDGRYVPTGDLSTITVPESLHALIAARLDALPAEERTLISHAAVLGQSFTLAGLAAVAGEDAEALEPRVQDLVRRELLVQNRDPRSPELGQYAFVQALIREVAYAGVARRDRKTRHLAAARHFESLGSEEMAGALAVHYLAAHENAAEGAEADAIAAQARIALKAAADRAIALGSHAQAATYLRQAIPLVTDPAEEADLLELAGRSASRTAHHDEAIGLVERAIEINRRLGDRGRIAQSVATLGDALLDARQLDRARTVLTEVAEEVGGEVRDPGLAAVLAQLARTHLIVGDYDATIEVAERVLPAAERMDLQVIVADTIITKGAALANLGRAVEGLALLGAGRDLARRRNAPMTELRALGNTSLALAHDDPVAALQLTRDAITLTERMGLREQLSVGNAVELALSIGEWEWARALVKERLATEPGGADLMLLLIARIALDSVVGHHDPDDAARLRELAPSVDEGRLFVLQLDGQLALVDGRLSVARRTAEEVASIDPLNALSSLLLAHHAALWDADGPAVERIAAAFADLPTRGRYCDAHGIAIRASVDGLRGRQPEALAGFLQASRQLDGLGVRVDRALNAIDMAAVLGIDAPEARAEVEAARTILEELGAAPYLAFLDRYAEAPAARSTVEVPSAAHGSSRETVQGPS